MSVVSEPMKADPSQHCQELIERLDALRENESFCDVTVAVKSREFKAHKLVLAAASPFFLSLLESDMKESNEQLIRIELEEATPCVMKDVLKYVYTGNVLVREESCHNLIATADYLLLPGLKTMACDFLKNSLTTENCLFNFYFADRYQCMELKGICRDVVNKHFSVVMEKDDFLKLDAKQVMEWVTSDDVIVSAEEEIFKGIVKWVYHDKVKRENNFLELLHQVRLTSISNDFFLNELVNEELITSNTECASFVMGSLKFVFGPTCKTGYKPPRHCLEIHKDGIFVCGGRKAFFFLPHENEWYQLEDMIFEHQNHAAVQYNDKVFIFDDQLLSPGNSYVAEYYMSSANSWAAMQTKFDYKERISSLVVLSNDLYTLAVDEEKYEDTLYIYDPKTNNWDIKIICPSRCWGACGLTDGNHLYLIGGTNCGDPQIDGTSKVVRFDPSADSCEEVAPMNEARHDTFGATMNGKIYVAGGLCRSELSLKVLGTCEVYNPSTDEWHVMPSLNVCHHSASMLCFKDGLYVVGGLKDKHKSRRELSVEMFDSEANEWKEKSTIPINHERQPGVKKTILNHFKACYATVHKDALESPF